MPPAECHGRPARAPAWVKTAMAHWEGRAALGPGSDAVRPCRNALRPQIPSSSRRQPPITMWGSVSAGDLARARHDLAQALLPVRMHGQDGHATCGVPRASHPCPGMGQDGHGTLGGPSGARPGVSRGGSRAAPVRPSRASRRLAHQISGLGSLGSRKHLSSTQRIRSLRRIDASC